MPSLDSLGIRARISTRPVEIDDGIPFDEDRVHADYVRYT